MENIYISNSNIFILTVVLLSFSLLFLILKILFRNNTEYYIFYGAFRTQRFMYIMEKLSKYRFVNYFEKISFYVGILSIGIIVGLLIFGVTYKQPEFAPVIPGITIEGITLPIIQTIIAIFIAAFIHEISHGILVYKNNLKLKDWGFFFLGPFLGAFVEPDEEELKKLDDRKQLSIFSAGATTNIIFGLIILGISFLLSYYISLYPNLFGARLYIVSVLNNTPAYSAGLKPSYIISIDNKSIYTLQQFNQIYYSLKPGENITIQTTSGTYIVHPSYLEITIGNETEIKPYIGVEIEQLYNPYILFIGSVLFWLFAINVGIGLANMLPIYPLDGGRAFESFLNMYMDRKKSNKIIKIVSLIILALLLYDVSLIFI